MTKQPIKVRDKLAALKRGGLILPDERSPLQAWLLIVMHPMDNRKGEVFISHARNGPKFDRRPGFEIIAHSFDKEAIQIAQRKLTLRLGEAYQPKHSAHAQARTPAPESSAPEDQNFSPMPEQPEDLLDALGVDPTGNPQAEHH